MINIIGTDISHYESPVDFNKMKSAAEYTIIKVGQKDFIDSDFYDLWNRSKGILPRGGFWFYDKRNTTPEGQAELWVSSMKGDYGELPLFADYEGILYGGNDIENFKKFLERVRQLVPNKEIVIYTGFYFWKDDSGYNSSYADFFKQFPLWLAWYGSTPQIPAPWTEYLFHQYTENGDGATYGCGGGHVDLDYFNGTKEEFYRRFNINMTTPPPVNTDETIQTHKGIAFHKIIRHGANCFVHVIDPLIARIQISDCGYQKPSYAVKKYNAQVVTNGGGWPNVQDANHVSNEMWVSNGRFMQNPKYIKDNRPYIDVSQFGVIAVSPNANIIQGIYNAVGFDRLLVIDGKFNEAITERNVPDARTASGMTADNKFVLLSVEGNDQKGLGLTFPQMAEVLIEFGCITAGNNDGGSSSTVINTAISPLPLFESSDGGEAFVINHIMIFAEALGIPEPPPTGANMYKVIKSARFRSAPTMNTTDTGASSVVGDTFESTTTQPDSNNPAITMVLHPNGKWLPLKIDATVYTQLISTPPPTNNDTFTATIKDDQTGEVWSGILTKQ